MEIQQCPFCFTAVTGKGEEIWCVTCQFQIWPVKEKEVNISAAVVKEQWDTRSIDKPMLVDVRRLDEYALTSIAGTVFIPMDEFPYRFEDLPKERHIVTYCHHGVRGGFAARFLRQHGYPNVHNMEGGIDAWAELDSTIVKY